MRTSARLGVLLSGGGRTLLNLQREAIAGRLDASIVLVIASTECAGAARAREAGLNVRVIPGRIPGATLGALLREHRVDLVCLAGYLKLLEIPPGYEGRVLNIHPALLPKFGGPGMYGRHVHEAVLAAREKESGCTVHFCDARYDTGAVVLRRRCPVLPGDTPETLAARVFEEECRAYPEAIRRVLAELA